MKNLFYLLFVSTCIIFSSCKKKQETVTPTSETSRSFAPQLRETGSYDYKSKKSGLYSDSSVWMKNVSGIWVDAHNVPDVNNNIYLEAHYFVTVDSNSACKDLNLNTSIDTFRVSTGTDSLFIHGKIRCYKNAAPGLDDGANAGIINWLTGYFVFTSTVDQIITTSTSYTANSNDKGVDWIIDYNTATATINGQVRCSNAVVKTGTLKVFNGGSLRTAGDGGITTNGSLTVKSGAHLIGGSFFKSDPDPMEVFTLESGATLEFNNTTSPVLAAKHLYINGTVIISGTTPNFPSGVGRTGAIPVDTIYNLTVKDSGAKKLLNNVSVTNTYSLLSPATINFNGFTLTNP